MTVEDFSELLGRLPFNPFTIHLADGRSFDVLTRDFVSIHHGRRLLFIWHAPGQGYSFAALDKVTHVSHMDVPLEAR